MIEYHTSNISNVKKKTEILSNFVAFSEHMNFTQVERFDFAFLKKIHSHSNIMVYSMIIGC